MTTMYALHPQKRTNPRIRTIYIFAEVRPAKEGVAAQCRRHGTGQTSSAAATLMADKVEVYEHLKEKHRDLGASLMSKFTCGRILLLQNDTIPRSTPPRSDSLESLHPPRTNVATRTVTEKMHQRLTWPRRRGAAENAPGRENERDKIMRQLRELCHLRDIGGVTEEEFTRERAKLAKILSTAEWCVLPNALFCLC